MLCNREEQQNPLLEIRAAATTKSLRQSLLFNDLGARTVVADFDGGALTSDGGALLLREVADQIGLFDQLDAAIPDPSDPQLIKHDQRAMLIQRVTAIALGCEDPNDHQNLRVRGIIPVLPARQEGDGLGDGVAGRRTGSADQGAREKPPAEAEQPAGERPNRSRDASSNGASG